MNGKYDDIINLPRHKSKIRSSMARADRAAQFMPFAALAGYEDSIRETARLTGDKIELDAQAKESVNRKLQLLVNNIENQPEVEIIYFVPDNKKPGGSYLSSTSLIKKIDESQKIIYTQDGCEIFIDDILDIRSEIFDSI
ncbi:MAG: hypothetical protein JXR63_02665 [Spirochaetales bacterium]|nr:hypothetical protein [Spirochaetales bacterium]